MRVIILKNNNLNKIKMEINTEISIDKIYTRDEVLSESIKYFKGDKMAADAWINKYALKDSAGNLYEKSPDDMHHRLASELARIELNYPNPISEEEIFEVIKDFKYIVPQGGPMSGIGNTKQTVSLSNCFVVGHKYDSYGAILRTDEEQVQLMKRRGGVGHDLSHIRPSGSEVKNSALTSTGLVPFMERYSNTTREVAQDGRRGALMLSCSIKHPDSEKFMDAKLEAGRVTGANISLKITDDFMEAVKVNGLYTQQYPVDSLNPVVTKEVNPKTIFNKIIHNAWKSAEPGILFWDTIINESIPDCYKDHGFETLSTNPCVTSDLWVMTNNGPRQVMDLIGQEFNVLVDNGSYLSENGFFYTGEKMVYLVEMNNGLKIKTTDNHKFKKVIKNNRGKKTTEWIELKDLNVGDSLNLNKNKNINFKAYSPTHHNYDDKIGWLIGSLVGDGSLVDNTAYLRYWGENRASMKKIAVELIKNKINYSDKLGSGDDNNDIITVKSSSLGLIANELGLYNGKNLGVKIEQQSSDFYRGFISGMFDADGTVLNNKEKGITVRLSSSNLNNLEVIQRMLLRLGIVSNISKNRRLEGKKLLPNGKGGLSEYSVQAQHELIISKENLIVFNERIGFKDINKQEKLDNVLLQLTRGLYSEYFVDKIKSITLLGIESVYDCTVNDVHEFDCNGISVHNCGEIPLCPYDSCRLISLNLFSYVENPFTKEAKFNFILFKKHVMLTQRIMDDIIDLELEKIDAIVYKLDNDPEPDYIKVIERNLWENIKNMCIKGRRTGVGVTAEGDMLAALGLTYGTRIATEFSTNVHKTLAINAYKSSCILAKERGSFEVWDYKKELNNPMIKRLCEADTELAEMLKHGRRNIALLTCAPTGTVSLMTQTTSGIEPVFLPIYKRRRKINPNDKNVRVDFIDENGDSWEEYLIIHSKFLLWLKINGYNIDDIQKYNEDELKRIIKESPYNNATSADVDWVEKVRMQGEIQKWVDHSISVTVNLPENTTEEIVSKVYMMAWESGCFKSGNDVYTKDGVKDISQIIIGDEVYGHDGNLHLVDDVYDLNEETRRFLKFKLNGYQSIESTSEHPFLVIELDETEEKVSWSERCKNLVWKKASDIKINDHLVVPNNFRNLNNVIKSLDLTKFLNCDFLIDGDEVFLARKLPWKKDCIVKASNSNQIPRYIDIDYDLCYFIGWFIAEGHFNSESYVRFTVNPETEVDVADKLIDICRRKFNIDGYKEIKKSNNGTSLTVQFGSKLLANIMRSFCGQYSENKHLPEWFMKIDSVLLNVILESHYLGDKGITISKRLSRELTMARNILNQKIYTSDNYGEGYEVKLKSSIKDSCSKEFETFYAYRVFNISDSFSNEKVYNFSVKDVDSYIINGVAVHNCKGITVYRDGSRSGVLISDKKIDKKTGIEIIKETHAPKRPKKLECNIVKFQNNHEKWIGFVGLYGEDKKPYEIFTGTNDSFLIPNYVEKGWIIKEKDYETNVSRYDFLYIDKDGYEQTLKGLNRAFNSAFWNYAKLISGILRHGMPIPSIISLIDTLHLDENSISSWKNGVKRMLKVFIKDGTVATGIKCPECGNEKLKYQDGCVSCDCGYSKCG
jgi:ribonucleotide reductase alpha subunit